MENSRINVIWNELNEVRKKLGKKTISRMELLDEDDVVIKLNDIYWLFDKEEIDEVSKDFTELDSNQIISKSSNNEYDFNQIKSNTYKNDDDERREKAIKILKERVAWIDEPEPEFQPNFDRELKPNTGGDTLSMREQIYIIIKNLSNDKIISQN